MTGAIQDLILDLPAWLVLAVVFLAPALESSAFFGFLFPGEIAVFLGGVLAYEDRLELGAVIAVAIVGAVVGDTIGYWVGRRYGRRLLHFLFGRLPFIGRHLDRHLDKARDYLQSKGGRAVFLGRWTAALRVLVPGLAGMSNMHYPKFLFWNIAGGTTWAVVVVLAGYYAGEAWHEVERYFGRASLALLALIVLAFIVTKAVRWVRANPERVGAWKDRVLAARPIAWARRRFPRGSAWLGRRLAPAVPTGLRLTLVTLVAAWCVLAFAALTDDVVDHEEATHLDPGVRAYAMAHRSAALTSIMKSVTWLGSSVVVVPLLVLVGVWFLLRARNWRPGMMLFAGYAGGLGSYNLVKTLVERPRPPVGARLVHVSGFAFPSGHATTAVVVYGILAGVLWGGRSARARVLLWVAASAIVFLIGASRIYLGAHWFTDVLGGYALGGLWLCVVVAVALFGMARRAPPRAAAAEEPATVVAKR